LQRAIGWVDQGYFKRLLGVEVKRMFGALCFMFNGHMCCGIEKDHLMVRVMPERYEALLKKPHAHKMDFTGKPLKGFLFISEAGYRTVTGLASWLDEAAECAESKPPKKKKAKMSRKARNQAVSPCRVSPPGLIGFTSSKPGDMMYSHCSTN
jgi:TfoX/Sxy family transcriptional regulator of competence genes